MKNKYFKILNLPENANQQEIKRAYRKLAMRYHPDVNSSASAKAKFILIKDAYEILSGQKQLPRAKQYNYNNVTPNKNRAQRTKSSAVISEKEKIRRFKEAQKRNEDRLKREKQDNDAFYKIISEGKLWKRFRVVMIACTILSSIFVIDRFAPSRWEKQEILKTNKNIAYSGFFKDKVTPVETNTNERFWVERTMMFRMKLSGVCYLEKSFWLNDIKRVWTFTDDGEFISEDTDFSVSGSFPLIPILLILPLITYALKSKTLTYSFLFHTSLYVFGALALLLLYSNDRWAHLITFGYI